MTTALSLSLLVFVALGQDPETPPAAANDGTSSTPASAENLRSRIHGMRMNLLLGGDRVREAEQEAARFYGEKREILEERLDNVHVELSEKRADYDVTLGKALESGSVDDRQSAMQSAASLRSQISTLEWESGQLEGKSQNLSQMVAAVESRDKDRNKLVAQLETNSEFTDDLGMGWMSIGLAPAGAEPTEALSPFDDDALIRDLLQRDPRAARALLFETDPARYWQTFPLRPPTIPLARALPFPLPDLPGDR